MITYFEKPVYIDVKLTDGTAYQLTNLDHILTIIPFMVKFYLKNGDVCAVPTSTIYYLGYGFMEDLDNDIHWPTTIYLRGKNIYSGGGYETKN